MFLLNLTLPQVLALFGVISGVVVTLYLLDRSRRQQTVSTLRFWVTAERSLESRHRRHIQQPLSLILQLLAAVCLLLAIAQLRLGSQAAKPRDHVLVFDDSAWMAARTAGGTLMDQARSLARDYVAAVPPGDRVMLVRADALTSPATVFESNLQNVDKAIAETQPGATALNLEQALSFARQAQKVQGGVPGEIVLVSALRIANPALDKVDLANVRVLPVDAVPRNCGLRKVGLRRSATDSDLWDVFVSVRNYGAEPRDLPLQLFLGNALVGERRMALPAGTEQEAVFHVRTRAAGLLDVRLRAADALADDDRATLELPAQKRLKVAVYAQDPENLRPVLAADPQVDATFLTPAAYPARQPADIVILEHFRPPSLPAVNTIWIDPPENGSPALVRKTVTNVPLVRWNTSDPLGAGLRVRDLKLASAEVFSRSQDDIVVAEVEDGPVILARPGKPKTVIVGFQPGHSALRYELATPLLFANILRWMEPEIFRRWDLSAGTIGTGEVALPADADPAALRVINDQGAPVPYTVNGHTVRFFSPGRGIVRVLAGDSETVYSSMLPDVADAKWDPPGAVRRGIPRFEVRHLSEIDLWHWLALLGGALLLLEWALFGGRRPVRLWSLMRKAVRV